MGVVYGCQEVPTHEMWKGQQEHEDARKNVHGRHIWQKIVEERESNTKEDIARKTVGPRLVNCFKLEQMGTTKLRRRSQNEKRQGHACRTFHMKLVENGCGITEEKNNKEKDQRDTGVVKEKGKLENGDQEIEWSVNLILSDIFWKILWDVGRCAHMSQLKNSQSRHQEELTTEERTTTSAWCARQLSHRARHAVQTTHFTRHIF